MQKKLYYAIKHFCVLLLALLCSTWAFSQQTGKIGGRVTDDRNEPIPGVVVLIKGTQKGVATSVSGDYSIAAAPGDVLLFKSVGYEAQEVTFRNQTVINVKLKATVTGLEEVTVSYGKQRSREVTGSVSHISAAPLADMPVMQFGQQLAGKAPGVQVSATSGQPGRGIAFRIRGAASFSTDYQPLFVIDGLPITGSINNINPDEIESYSILKDASATALYGSRAANGVVLITTKHAKAGDSKVEYTSNVGVQKIPGNRVPKMMNATEFGTFMQQRFEDKVKYEGLAPSAIPTDYQGDMTRYGEGTNWFKLLTQSAPIQSHTLTVMSAHEKSSSTVIAGYEAQDGVIINTGTQLFSLRINQSLSIGDNNKLKIGFNLAPTYRRDHNNRLSTDGVGGYFERFFEASPIVSPYNPDGSYAVGAYSSGMVAYVNPLALLKESRDDYATTRILGNAYLNYEFIPGLSLKTNFGADKGGETRNQFSPSVALSTQASAPVQSTGLSSSVDNYSYTAEANLNYEKTFFTDHHIEALVGYSAQKFDQKSNTISATGYPSDDIQYLSNATTITAGGSNTTQYSLLSAIARLSYNFKGKYLLQGAIRRDGSSRFGTDNQYGYFPSISAGWVMSDEKFMEKFKSIDLLKIRASYGITGNNFFSNYLAQSQIHLSNYTYNGVLVPGQVIDVLGNTQLQWERNKQFDIGLDLSLLHNRINFTYDYYHKNTDHLIMPRPIPRASGFVTIISNVGDLEMWGHEFGVNTVNLTGKLKWNSNFNVSIDRNLVKKLVSPGYLRRNNTVSSDYFRIQEGHHLGEFYGFVFLGLYKDAADLASSAKYQATSANPNGVSNIGTIKVADINGDGVIDDVNDRTFIGDPTPDFNFGFTNDFRYKNFDLGITMSGSVGGKVLNAAKWAYQTNMDGSRVPVAAALDHWRSEADPGSGVYPRTLINTTAMGRQVNSQWVENGSYLTAKNISLGYNLKLKNSMMLKNLRLYASVQQAFIITGYSGMNPEISLSGLDANSGIGVDEQGYPIPRTFSIGISTTFK
jgi:TonB-linked SusC/RagA family outer membrane protein